MRKKKLSQVNDFINQIDVIAQNDNWNFSTMRTFDSKVDVYNRKVHEERYAVIVNDDAYEKRQKQLKKYLMNEYHCIKDLDHYAVRFFEEYQSQSVGEMKYFLKGIYTVLSNEKSCLKENEAMDAETFSFLYFDYLEKFYSNMDLEFFKVPEEEKYDLLEAAFFGVNVALADFYDANIRLNNSDYVQFYVDSELKGIELFEAAEEAEVLSDFAFRTYPKFFNPYITQKDISLICTPLFLSEKEREKKLLTSFACFMATRLDCINLIRESGNGIFITNIPDFDSLMDLSDSYYASSYCYSEITLEDYDLIADYAVDIYESLMDIWSMKMERTEAKKVYKELSKVYR